MSLASPLPEETVTCPACRADLVLSGGPAAFWVCPNGHGMACTMTVAYSRVRDDEIAAIWQASEHGAPSSRACPMCQHPMVTVDVSGDSDAPESVTIDVCRDDEVFWLDAGELDELPRDVPKPEPTAQEQRNLEIVRREFDEGLDQALHEEMSSSRFDRMADAIARRHPGFTRMLDEAVYHGSLDDMQDDAGTAG